MEKASPFLARSGCLISLLAPLVGLVVYPRAKWLFAFVLVGPAILVVLSRFAKDPLPHELADQMERLLTGEYGGYDVDHYEHLSPRDPVLREFWQESMKIGGLPEEWVGLDEERKAAIRDIIQRLRDASLKSG